MQQTTKKAVSKAWRGTIFHSLSLEELEIIEDGVIALYDDGTIALVHKKVERTAGDVLNEVRAAFPEIEWASGVEITQLPPKAFIVPGFVDTHTHAPQYVFAGTAMDLPLLDWLNKYTFPTESRFGNEEHAAAVYEKVILRSLGYGTTTSAYYGTIHNSGTKILAELAVKLGQRAFIGKVSMDRNSPDNYREDSSEVAIKDAEDFVNIVLSLNSPLVRPIITPRFVPTCTLELMKGLAAIAKKYDIHIQSHISENLAEIKWVSELHPDMSSYTEVYNQCGLMTNKTIMAHGIYLSDQELDIFKETGAVVSHCPNSNFTIQSGVLEVRRLLDRGVRVGLGTDVAGGYSSSMLDAFRHALVASKVAYLNGGGGYNLRGSTIEPGLAQKLETRKAPPTPLKYFEVFYLITLGGAEAMSLGDKIGNFLVGKEFDALIVDPTVEGGPFDLFDSDSTHDVLEKWLNLGDNRNITEVYVKGRRVL